MASLFTMLVKFLLVAFTYYAVAGQVFEEVYRRIGENLTFRIPIGSNVKTITVILEHGTNSTGLYQIALLTGLMRNNSCINAHALKMGLVSTHYCSLFNIDDTKKGFYFTIVNIQPADFGTYIIDENTYDGGHIHHEFRLNETKDCPSIAKDCPSIATKEFDCHKVIKEQLFEIIYPVPLFVFIVCLTTILLCLGCYCFEKHRASRRQNGED